MREFTALKQAPENLSLSAPQLVLSYADRQKSRLRAQLADGESVGILLPHGQHIKPGALLTSADGSELLVVAAEEKITSVYSDDALLLTRAAYHLGNRHVPVEIGEGWLRYEPDHVLDEMLLGLGLKPQSELAPFNPESGAYASNGHHHHA